MATVRATHPRVFATPRASPSLRARGGTPRAVASARRARRAVAPDAAAARVLAVPGCGLGVARRRRLGSSARPARDARLLAVDEDRSAGARARLDAIQKQEQDALFVEDPGERGSVDMFSGLNLTPEVLTYWESQHAFFFPRLLLFSMTALGLAASVPQSLGGVFRGDTDAPSVLATNVLFLVVAAAVTAADLSGRKKELGRLQRELALGDMRVIQRDKFRNERVFPLASLRQAARVAIVYGDADKVAKDLAAATPFRRRLEQSRILVVPVVERARE